jgi:hypothetical protein
MTSNIQDQEGNILPPRIGFVMAVTVDSTSRGYDLTLLKFQDEGLAPNGNSLKNELWLRLTAVTNDVFFAFDSAAAGTNTINDATLNAAGSAAAFTSGGCDKVVAGTTVQVRIDRLVDKTLILKAASASGSLRISQASQSLPGSTFGS